MNNRSPAINKILGSHAIEIFRSDGAALEVYPESDRELERGSWAGLLRMSADETCGNGESLKWRFLEWSPDVHVLMPGAVYAGNRLPAFETEYPPMPVPRAVKDFDRSLQISSLVPRLNAGPGPSRLLQSSADCSVPGVGLFHPGKGYAIWLLTPQNCGGELIWFDLEENEDRSAALLSLQAGSDGALAHGQALEIFAFIFPCESIRGLYRALIPLRNRMVGGSPRRPVLPFSEAWKILEAKQNRDNWVEPHGYYSVGTEPLRSKDATQNWQMGWTGGMITAFAMVLQGDGESVARALRNFDFVFPNAQSPSGLFYGVGNGQSWYGEHFRDRALPWHLVRKSGDGLYYMLRTLDVLRARGQGELIKTTWESGLRKCADAFVAIWDRNGQFGQFVDHNTGEIVVANSTSGAIVPAALLLAADYFGDSAGAYLRVAEESARAFVEELQCHGFCSGGPGDAAQCADSESVAGLIESLVFLHRRTGDPFWLASARDAADHLSSWVVSYDFKFPEGSTFARLGMETVGTVLANAQNKHSAPGLCTYAGSALLYIFRATDDPFYLDLLRDIAHALPQFLSRKDRPIPFRIPYCQPSDPERTELDEGWMNERVNMSRWGEEEYPGEVFYCSCWPELSLMLTAAELPSVYARSDTREIWCLDHVVAKWGGDNLLTILNPTPFDAVIKVAIQSGPHCEPVCLVHECKAGAQIQCG